MFIQKPWRLKHVEFDDTGKIPSNFIADKQLITKFAKTPQEFKNIKTQKLI